MNSRIRRQRYGYAGMSLSCQKPASKFSLIAALVVLLSPLASNAASISLNPGLVDGVSNGDVISFDIVMDFSDNPTLGGGFDIVFDSSALQFESFFRDPAIGDPSFSRDPDILDGLLESWAVGSFTGLPNVATLGSVQFSVLSTMGASTFVATRDTTGIGGPWISSITFVDIIPVDYFGAEVRRGAGPGPAPVPEPGTLTLLSLGLAGIAFAKRGTKRLRQ